MCILAAHHSVPHFEHFPAAAAASSHYDVPAQISDAPKVDAEYLPPRVDGTVVECAKKGNKIINQNKKNKTTFIIYPCRDF